MKILVTGGAGFIGSNVVDAYLEAGHDVVIMDNLFSGKWENINHKAKFYLMDICSEEVSKVFEKEQFDAVNHHAAQMSVPASVEDPLFDADVNVKGFINLLEAPEEKVSHEIFNVGSNEQNYQIKDIGQITNRIIPEAKLLFEEAEEDQRNYRVSFDKIHHILDYETKFKVEDGIREIQQILLDKRIENYQDEIYYNVRYKEYT